MSNSWTYYPAVTAPGTLDVVWCHFPIVEFPDSPGPKPRPALVRQVLNRNGDIFVQVCYGTSKVSNYSNRDLYVANAEDMVYAGLPQATIFQLDRLVYLPWAEEWFGVRTEHSTPIVGHLSQRSTEYLRYLIEHHR